MQWEALEFGTDWDVLILQANVESIFDEVFVSHKRREILIDSCEVDV